ncbi:MAG: cobalt-precorrin-5B (C(1))-methyltransferase CbiD [Victivallales bacterium]|jgi:cobalt-precorrin-5B (C1)-methyltransferase|nr:cobalt-precorrin-5B (C(1))-methyltransferase CbiD [Victivallales bacterium]
MKTANHLRCGFTTGSAMTAAAVAVYRNEKKSVDILLPHGEILKIPIARQKPDEAVVIKDGGDDPDVTNNCEIVVKVERFEGNANSGDIEIPCGKGLLILRGGTGIGRVTRPGLAVPVGKAAINPGPCRILAKNMEQAKFGNVSGEKLLITVSVPAGEIIAQKTLNSTLGVEGGISILGNSGIVRPYSHEAYAATIALRLRSLAACGVKTVAFTTGNKSTDAIRRDYPELLSDATIPIADFIKEAINSAVKEKFEQIIIGCMPGKLFKYACNFGNTHAHYNSLNLTDLRKMGVNLPDVALEEVKTMGALAALIGKERYKEVLDNVYTQALATLKSWAGTMELKLLLYDREGRKIR